MDLNLLVLCGRVAAPPERLTCEGSDLLRLLVTVGIERPRRRIDLLAVHVWDPPPDLTDRALAPGTRVWVAGRVQRRFVDQPLTANPVRTRLEIVAEKVTVTDDEFVDEGQG